MTVVFSSPILPEYALPPATFWSLAAEKRGGLSYPAGAKFVKLP